MKVSYCFVLKSGHVISGISKVCKDCFGAIADVEFVKSNINDLLGVARSTFLDPSRHAQIRIDSLIVRMDDCSAFSIELIDDQGNLMT